MDKIVYIDPSGREWIKGGTPDIVPTEVGNLIVLPFFADAMHPEPLINDDYIFSTCVKCGKSLERGLVSLLFDDLGVGWGVRITCCVQVEHARNTPIPITHITSILEPIILKAWKEINYQCVVCTRSRCNDPRCLKMLENGMIRRRPVLDHFYNVKLNVVSPLVATECVHCGVPDCKKMCRVCRIVCFCSYKCKKLSRHVEGCTNHFYAIWG